MFRHTFVSRLIIVLIGLFTVTVCLAADGTDIGFKGIGVRLGYVDPESSLNGTILMGVVADLGTITDKLYTDASLTYWKSSYSVGWMTQSWDYSISDIAFRAGVKYHFLEGEWQPYAGGGLGLHFYGSSVETPSGYSAGYGYSDGTEFGLYVDGGVEHQFTDKLKGSAELQFDTADINQTALQVNLIYIVGRP